MLESLERRNLFVVPLDDQRRWYRYHHLFADVLRAHLLAEQPERVAGLHRRASAWFQEAGEPVSTPSGTPSPPATSTAPPTWSSSPIPALRGLAART